MFSLTEIVSIPFRNKFSQVFKNYETPSCIATNDDGYFLETDTLEKCKKTNDILAYPLSTSLNKVRNQSCANHIRNFKPPRTSIFHNCSQVRETTVSSVKWSLAL